VLPQISLTAHSSVQIGEEYESSYMKTLLTSLAWVGFFSWLITVVVARWVALSGIPSGVFGVTVVALGGQVPDIIQSVAVAKRGYGDMAMSNALGSQNLNLFVGLGENHNGKMRMNAPSGRYYLMNAHIVTISYT
jgi:Ca2+/Na+ antiporter